MFTPALETKTSGVPDKPKEVVAKLAVDAVPVKLPTKLVAVTTPTLRLGLPLKPVESPVKFPTKLVAVTIPTLRFGVPLKPKEVVAKETDQIPVIPDPSPTKLVAVTTPVAFTPPETLKSLKVDNPTAPISCAFVCDIMTL